MTVYIILVFGDQFLAFKSLCISEGTVGIAVKWHSFSATAVYLHFCDARWPEGDRFQLTHVAVRAESGELIRSVNKVVETTAQYFFITVNTHRDG